MCICVIVVFISVFEYCNSVVLMYNTETEIIPLSALFSTISVLEPEKVKNSKLELAIKKLYQVYTRSNYYWN